MESSVQPWQLTDGDLLREITELDLLADRVALRRAVLVAEAETRGATQKHGLSTAEWLNHTHRVSLRSARAQVLEAVELTAHEATMAAVARGEVSMAQARVVVDAVGQLPDEFSADQVLDAELMLLDHCGDFDPVWLRKLGRRAVAIIAPEVADARDEAALMALERRARRDRWFSWRADGCGSVLFKGQLPAVEAELVIETLTAIVTPATPVVEAVAAVPEPVEAAVDLAGLPVDPETGWSVMTPEAADVTVQDQVVTPLRRRPVNADDLKDVRSANQRHADALVELCRGWNPEHGEAARPRVVVTIGLDALQQGTGKLGSATLVTTGEPVSVGEARRLACDAGIVPAVLGGQGQVLDLGRERRLATGACRQALILRDRGCAFPGCEKPPRECEAHHILPWWQGGPTALGNLVLLCAHHHRLVEPNRVDPAERTWKVEVNPHTGWAEFGPPENLFNLGGRVRMLHPRLHPALAS